MSDAFMHEAQELIRETFEGGRPGEGTQYLDHDSGILNTLRTLTAEQASERRGSHPSIAGHVRHMIFHLRVAREWIQGDHGKRDWKGSFLPPAVTPDEWTGLLVRIQEERAAYMEVLESLPPEKRIPDGGAMGVVAHLAYHLGAIRQLLPAP